MNAIKKFLRKIGIDKSIAYVSGARIIQALSGVISIFFIARFLSSEEQGFFFTFGSIVAIQVFFELGFNTVLTQFVSHEAAVLRWNSDGLLDGEERNLSRLSSLIHFTLKWYLATSLILILFLIAGGNYFFETYNKNSAVNWEIPWIFTAFSVSTKFVIAPFHSILMGLGKIKEVSKMQLGQQLIIPAVTFGGLALGWDLNVVGAGVLASSLYCVLYMHRTGLLRIMRNLYKKMITQKISYKDEIFPFQWKISVSWMSGYFIYQLFNPVLFATSGPVVAGQMGLTMQGVSGIVALSAAWMHTKVPVYSKYIALKEYATLDKLFNKTFKQMAAVTLFLFGIFLGLFTTLQVTGFSVDGEPVYRRFLPYLPMILIMASAGINQAVATLASYLRCHKREPFLAYSVALGCASLTLIPVSGRLYGLYGVCVCYFLLQVAFSRWGCHIYKTKKRQWHETE